MRTDDLKTLVDIGVAIWGDPEFSHRTTVETVAAVSLLDLNPEQTVERAATVLLERAAKEGAVEIINRHAAALGMPFFRLSADERFILVVLHAGRWPYERVARVLDVSVEEIESRAWAARVKLFAKSPAGAPMASTYCPEYLPSRPWTQRFLDEEIASGTDRLFLQNHLMVCDSCRAALNRCRELYFAVEAMIPRESQAEEFVRILESTRMEGRKLRGIELATPSDALKGFLLRPEVLFVLLVGGFLLLVRWF